MLSKQAFWSHHSVLYRFLEQTCAVAFRARASGTGYCISSVDSRVGVCSLLSPCTRCHPIQVVVEDRSSVAGEFWLLKPWFHPLRSVIVVFSCCARAQVGHITREARTRRVRVLPPDFRHLFVSYTGQ